VDLLSRAQAGIVRTEREGRLQSAERAVPTQLYEREGIGPSFSLIQGGLQAILKGDSRMSDVLPFPPRPNLEQYKKLARDLQHASTGSIAEWASRWPGDAARIEQHWREFGKSPCTLTEAQFFLARQHGFASWSRFAEHVEALAEKSSGVSQFEAAADAIVSGDMQTLGALLSANPELVLQRSMRDHQSTLLHYVSANGVEDYRQKSPPNILEIARLLLDAGADVNAESDAYGGGSTALNLTATSVHPERAGVQIALMELLLDRGAKIRKGDVWSCLGNGRGEAAEFLASKGAPLNSAEAAGVGRLDLVRANFDASKMTDALGWACQFSRHPVVEFLVEQKPSREALDRGLHWAAYAGEPEIVKTLLARGAPADEKDDRFHATPLGWAMHAKRNGRAGRFDEVFRLLIAAGAKAL